MTTFFKNLLMYCEKAGVSPSAVAKSCGIATSAVVKWRNLDTIPTKATLSKIADYFGVSVEDILSQRGGGWIKVIGNVAAGIPIEAIEDVVDEEQLSPDYDSSYEYFGLRIRGDSMYPFYLDGDNIIVRRQDDVESGDVAVVMVNGSDATCKKVVKVNDGIELHSLNTKYGVVFYTNEQIKTLPIVILGKVVELRRKFK